jgi:hypothetical protein
VALNLGIDVTTSMLPPPVQPPTTRAVTGRAELGCAERRPGCARVFGPWDEHQ